METEVVVLFIAALVGVAVWRLSVSALSGNPTRDKVPGIPYPVMRWVRYHHEDRMYRVEVAHLPPQDVRHRFVAKLLPTDRPCTPKDVRLKWQWQLLARALGLLTFGFVVDPFRTLMWLATGTAITLILTSLICLVALFCLSKVMEGANQIEYDN